MKQELIQKLASLKENVKTAFLSAQNQPELYQAKVRYLGKKGELTDVLKGLGGLAKEDRPQVGTLANQLKSELEELYASCEQQIQQSEIKHSLNEASMDTSLPGVGFRAGHRHPVTSVLRDLKAIFTSMGFDIHEGPEIEDDYYNFEALNIPKDHPARDMQDTFYLGDQKLLRTHTSPVQIRLMEKSRPPIHMISPGVVYRRDSDVSHTPMFHQIEGLVVDQGITMVHLKGVIGEFLENFFLAKIKTRFRSSFFPFTEPSAEVDIACVLCKGNGCRVCKQSGWLEVMGCGMVDPAVFGFVGIDPKKYTGFAFGLGVERLAMLKYGINDIRLFFENNPEFLGQF